MAIIKSSADHLTLNADGSAKDIKFQADGVEKASISSAGAFTSTTIDATALTGNLPAISGASLTNLDASDLATGTVPTARLGSGTAGSGNFLRGDGAWEAAGGGKMLQVKFHQFGSQDNTTSTSWVTTNTLSLTPASGSTLLFIHTLNVGLSYNSGVALRLYRDGTTNLGSHPSGADSDGASHFIKTGGVSGDLVHASHTATWFYVHGGDGSTSMSFSTQRRMSTSSNTSYFQYYGSNSSLTIIEIGA